jgi:hypothetical protein
LALARLWLSPAAIWLLDEPYANLDLDGIDLVNRMIAAHRAVAPRWSPAGAHVAPPAPTRTLWLGPQQATVPGDRMSRAALRARDGAGPVEIGAGAAGRDLLLARARRALQPALFALLVVVVFALALGGERERWPPSRRPCCGWPCCWPACWRWTTCSATTSRTARWNNGGCRPCRWPGWWRCARFRIG